ncbi:hypothetical protein [Pseudooceanicola sp.]|nr:hypothetical protein [Pseudooceanicola sp.]MDF1855158.1 hypothetical protein [Pseudooceanicola sp.]
MFKAIPAAGRRDAYLAQAARLRIATVLRTYGLEDRTEAPADSRARHDG